jgi:serine/threonine protein kinase
MHTNVACYIAMSSRPISSRPTPNASGQRRTFLADFGIARPLADPSGLTATNLTIGTVAYAAPEQLMGEQFGDPNRARWIR